MDSLRAIDRLSRDLRRKYRAADAAVAALTGQVGREPTSEEIAGRLELTVTTWHRLEQQLHEAGYPVNGHGFTGKPATLIEHLPARDGGPKREPKGRSCTGH